MTKSCGTRTVIVFADVFGDGPNPVNFPQLHVLFSGSNWRIFNEGDMVVFSKVRMQEFSDLNTAQKIRETFLLFIL